ncbi:cysteine desulfurase [Thermomicrobium sp. 4228-Ro]|uniref:cysteine desulfurase n=1 Tax=Thermomicrobium sp. 4228-Ro TaxID=2993937 RepID=UPI002248FF8C|nr:cysteine desulfurase [Thermomicrobium sp. 4228-Ro]MCX2726484.1 cysteine desulfurase [Thermomicrobium sp. 4228-Ro]
MNARASAQPLDVERIRADFPILQRTVRGGKPLVYLDSAATSQKPASVIEALAGFYRSSNANIHRGIYELSEEASALYEEARAKVARFIGAARAEEVIFVRNTTEAINLVARVWGTTQLRAGDVVVTTILEHHSNIVPWYQLAAERGVVVRFVDIDDDGRLRLEQLEQLLRNESVKLVAVTHVSNALGTINPIREIARLAHDAGALLLVDGAQSVPHLPVNVRELGADFLAFSGHKMLGPFGIGVLWARYELLQALPPFLGGGGMIRTVTTEGFTPGDVPARFEAGTPSVADAVALGAAIEYLEATGMAAIRQHEQALLAYALPRLEEIPGIRLFGPVGDDRAGVISFTFGDVHPHDVAAILDQHGVAVRAGHHCTQPLMRRLGVVATTRASFYLYNHEGDVDRLVEALEEVRRVFGVTG